MYSSLHRLLARGGQDPVCSSNLWSLDSASLVSIGYASFWRGLDQRLLITDSCHTLESLVRTTTSQAELDSQMKWKL